MSNIAEGLEKVPTSKEPRHIMFGNEQYVWYIRTLYHVGGDGKLHETVDGSDELVNFVWSIVMATKFPLSLTARTPLSDVLHAIKHVVPRNTVFGIDDKYVVISGGGESSSWLPHVYRHVGDNGRMACVPTHVVDYELNKDILTWAARLGEYDMNIEH